MKNSKGLSAKEVLQRIQLESLVEEYRTLVFEYLLLRASLSTNRVEKKAWWILAALLTFVERNHRFPRLKQQIAFLKLSATQMPELPKLQLLDLVEQKELGRQAQVLRRQLSKKRTDEGGR